MSLSASGLAGIVAGLLDVLGLARNGGRTGGGTANNAAGSAGLGTEEAGGFSSNEGPGCLRSLSPVVGLT